MKDFVFVAHDPGGLDVVYPVAMELGRVEDAIVQVALSGQAANKQPLFKMSDADTLKLLHSKVEAGDNFILVTGTSWDSEIEQECIDYCKQNSIITVSILDYWSNYKKRFKNKDHYSFPDKLFVMDKLAYDEAVADGLSPEILKITGSPGLDYYVKKKVHNKKILFLSQPLSMLYDKDKLGYDEFAAFEFVLKACRELNVTPNIKFHPKETKRMKELYHEYSIEDNIEDVIGEYDALIGMVTMGLLQGSLMGVPVISFQPKLKTDDACIINKLGIAQGTYTYEELLIRIKMITGTVDEKNLPFWYDGKSTERCVKELLSM